MQALPFREVGRRPCIYVCQESAMLTVCGSLYRVLAVDDANGVSFQYTCISGTWKGTGAIKVLTAQFAFSMGTAGWNGVGSLTRTAEIAASGHSRNRGELNTVARVAAFRY